MQTLPLFYLKRNFPQHLDLEIRFPNIYDPENHALGANIPSKKIQAAAQVLAIQREHPEKLPDYLQCFSFDPTHHSCVQVLGLDLSSAEPDDPALLSELRRVAPKNQRIFKAQAKKGNPKIILPAVFINGELYQKSLFFADLIPALNQNFEKGEKIPGFDDPSTTNTLNPPVQLYVIKSKKNKINRNKQWETQLLRRFPNLTITPLSAESSRGRKIIKQAEIQTLPAYVFDRSLQNNRTDIALGLLREKLAVKKKGYFVLNSKRGVTEYFLGRKKKRHQLDLFVMSQCPFGVRAENKVINSLENNRRLWPKNFQFNIRYIVSKDSNSEGEDENGGSSFQSLHGSAELEENIRQIVIQKYYPDKFLTYLKLRNQDYRSCLWQDAAREAGVDLEKVRNHLGEGAKMLDHDFQAAQELGIRASPTYVWENQYVLASGDEWEPILGFDPLATSASTNNTNKNSPPPSCQ